MKRLGWAAVLVGLVWAPASAADDLKMPVNLDKLAARATETVDVTLDSSMLQLAGKFLSNEDPDSAKVKKIVGKLKSVYVRSFEFSKAGEYSPGDVESLREQLKGPVWSRIVGVRSRKGENSDIFVKRDGDKVVGLVVIALEPKELTIVHIDGDISLEELSELGGNMGIPKIDGKKGKEDQKGKEE
jgi:hypothetical protein